MARVTKKQIKEDKLVSTTTKISIYIEENWKKIASIAGAVIVVIAVIIAFYGYTGSKNSKASLMLSEAIKLYEEAESAMQKDGNIESTISKYDTAKAKFQEVIDYGGSRSTISKAIFLSARCSYQAGKYNEAVAGYEKFLNKYPKSPYALSARDSIAKSYVQIGDDASIRKAIQYYDELSKNPESYITVDALLSKGICYEKLGEKDKAIEAYKIVVDRFKVKVESAIQEKSKEVAQKAKNAIEKYQDALGSSASDTNFKSLLEKAQSLEKSKKEQWFETLLAYDKAILARNDYWQEQSASASSSSKLKIAETALREYESQSLDMIKAIGMGRKYEADGDWDTAVRYYGRAAEFSFLPTRDMYIKAQSKMDLLNIAKQEGKPEA